MSSVYGPGEDMERFRQMDLDEISDWFESTDRPMSSAEKAHYERLCEIRHFDVIAEDRTPFGFF